MIDGSIIRNLPQDCNPSQDQVQLSRMISVAVTICALREADINALVVPPVTLSDSA